MYDRIEHYTLPQNLPSSPLLRTHFFSDEFDGIDNHDYRFESNRLRTFKDKDWPSAWVKPERLAAAGFYYTGQSDKVKCFECSIEMSQWQKDDNPMVDHHRWSGKCRFVCNLPCGNVPIGADPSTIPAPSPKGKDVCGPYGMVYMPLSGSDNDLEETVTFNLNSRIGAAIPKHIEYDNYNARLRTFENWPISMKQKKEDLASAGLCYTGMSDRTLCFYCGGGLNSWELDDDPWEEHARWFEHCPYVLRMKGREFISKVTGKTYENTLESISAGEPEETQVQEEEPLARENSPNSVASGDIDIESVKSACSSEEQSVANIQSDKSVDKDMGMCRICCSKELQIVFQPCGHLLSCVECAENMKICGVCRMSIEYSIRIYIS